MGLMDNLTSGFNDAGEAFNQVTDTIGDASAQLVSDAEEAFNYDAAPDNRKEELPKVENHWEPVPELANRKEEVPEDVDTSSQDNNLTDIQNMLLNPDEQFKKAVEQGQIEIPDWEKDLFAAAAEVDDTSSQDNKDFNLGDAAHTLADFVKLTTPVVGQTIFLAETVAGDNQGLNNKDVTDTLVDALPQVVSNSVNSGAEAFNQATDTAKKTVDKTVNNLLPANIGKNLGLALYGILAVAAIAVFVYILSLLKPIFQIGANVSEK